MINNLKKSVGFYILMIISAMLLLTSCNGSSAPKASENNIKTNTNTELRKQVPSQKSNISNNISDNLAEIVVSDSNNVTKLKIIEESNNVVIKYFKSKNTYNYTWPGIFEDKIVFANHPQNTMVKQSLILYDIKSNKEKAIYIPEANINIDDTKIIHDWIFWVEGSMPIDWEIKAYDIKNNKIITVKEGHNDSFTLIPRINNDKNKLLWLEGSKDNEGVVNHIIYSFDPKLKSIEEISKVNYVENPYQIIIPRNNYLSFADKIENDYVIRLIDLSNKKELSFQSESMPNRPVSDGKFIAWTEGESGEKLYMYDIESKEKYLIENRVDYFDISNSNIIFSKNSQIYKYDIKNKVKEYLTSNAAKINKEFMMWFSCYGNNITCIQPNGPGNSNLAVITFKSK